LVIILTDGLLVGTRDLIEEANNLKNFASVLTVALGKSVITVAVQLPMT
jgi:hypothetical protein